MSVREQTLFSVQERSGCHIGDVLLPEGPHDAQPNKTDVVPGGFRSQCWERGQPCTVSLCDMSLCGHKASWSQGELLSSWEEG